MGLIAGDTLFIHVPKCGGVSVKEWLTQNMDGVENPFPIGHIPLMDIERYSGRPPDSFESILVVIRDPYAHTLSQWSFWRDRYARGDRHPHDITAASHPTLTTWLHEAHSDFRHWYEQTNLGKGRPLSRSYFRWWMEVDGAIPEHVLCLGLENLDQLPGLLGVDAPPPQVRNTSPHGKDVTAYFTPEAVEIVNNRFQWTFEQRLYPKLICQSA